MANPFSSNRFSTPRHSRFERSERRRRAVHHGEDAAYSSQPGPTVTGSVLGVNADDLATHHPEHRDEPRSDPESRSNLPVIHIGHDFVQVLLYADQANPPAFDRAIKRPRLQLVSSNSLTPHQADGSLARHDPLSAVSEELTDHLARDIEMPDAPEVVIALHGHNQTQEVEMLAGETDNGQLVIDSSYDEDAWPVDDARRTFDVVEFVKSWRALPGRPPQAWREPIGALSEPNAGPELDMQGIRWDALNTTRENARRARRQCHPSKTAAIRATWKSERAQPDNNAGSQYVFRNYTPSHRAAFGHFQLRSVLAANGRNHIFYAAGGTISRTALSCPGSCDVVLDVSKSSERTQGMRIACLGATQKHPWSEESTSKVLLAGGFDGEFVLLDSTNDPIQGTLTYANNGIVTHINPFTDRRSGLFRASFCSNEGKVRLMDIRTLQLTDTFYYDHSINCSATTSDSRLRAVVGDMKETLITDAERGDVLVTLQQHQDHAFACAWSYDGRYVATGAQDSSVVVWDARNWSIPLAVRPTLMSCAGSVHFTVGGDLIVAECEDIVSIYNKTTFNLKQDISFFGSVAGVTLVNGGEELVVANCDKTVGGLLSFESRNLGSSFFSERSGALDCAGLYF